MTISSSTRKAGPFSGTGTTGPFTFAFKVFVAADLYVVKLHTSSGVETVLTLDTDYTVSLNADQNAHPGGTVTLVAALDTGYTLTLTSVLDYTQETDLTNQGGFYPSVITNSLDKLTILAQQLNDNVDRTLKISVTTPDGVSTQLPAPATNKVIGWDNTGVALRNWDVNDLVTTTAYGTAVADIFTGDNTTTAFTLSYDPANINNLDVSVGGVTQVPGVDYVWTSGVIMTFTTAPPTDATILARYMRAVAQGSIDWGSVGSRPFIDTTIYINSTTSASSLYTAINVVKGGSFVIASGSTFTIDVPFTAGRFQVFSGSGDVKFSDASSWASTAQNGYTRTVYPEWWGGDIQAACYAISAQTASSTSPTYLGGFVSLAQKYYQITSTLIIPDHVWVGCEGGGMRQGCIQASGSWTATNPVVQLGRVLGTQYWSHDCRIVNCTVDGNFKANTGIYSASVNEGSGIENVMVRNFLLKGVHYEDVYAGSTSSRIVHAFIREVQAFAPVAQYPASYPTPANVRGIEISAKTGVATYRVTPGIFTNFEISKCTVSCAAGQNDSSPVMIGAGFYLNGIAGVSITDSHAEYCTVDVVLGDNYPVRNCRVVNFDGYVMDPTTIQIGSHTSTDAIVLENIYNNYYSYLGITSRNTISDLRTTSLATITDVFVTRYSVSCNYLIGNAATAASHIISRSRSGTYTAPAGTALLVEATAATNCAVINLAGGAGSTSHAIFKMSVEGGSTVDALSYYNGEILIDNGYAGRKVTVPATATSTGKQGQFAADGTYLYICTATNTWRRVAISSF